MTSAVEATAEMQIMAVRATMSNKSEEDAIDGGRGGLNLEEAEESLGNSEGFARERLDGRSGSSSTNARLAEWKKRRIKRRSRRKTRTNR